MKRLLFDSESDGFVQDATKVHCIADADVDTGERQAFKPDEIPAALKRLDTADVLIGHNIIRHDLPLLYKLYGFRPRPNVIIRDTLVLARLIYPNIRDTDAELLRTGKLPRTGAEGDALTGKHTLEAWGYRLGEQKTPYVGGWEEWNPTMHLYMIQDVTTNMRLWQHCQPDKYSQEAIELEHRAQVLCWNLEADGVPFDQEKAVQLHSELVAKKSIVENALVTQFGSWLAPISPNPERTVFTPKKDNAKKGITAGVPYSKLKRVTFNPSSRDHIAKVLMDRGWEPKSRTPGGKAQIDEAVVAAAVSTYPDAAGLSDFLMLDKRLQQLADGEQSWLRLVKEDGRIHGVVNPMGTTTSRASHFYPNLAQVPAVKSPYGKECRSLFYVPEPFVMVGADMAGLEGRGFAHYLTPIDGGAYAKQLLSGDPHWATTQALGFVPEGTPRDKDSKLHVIVREGSKTFYYAFLYGCGNAKAGNIILDVCLNAKRIGFPEVYEQFFGKSASAAKVAKVGKKAREDFITKTPGLAELKQKVASRVQRYGWVPGLDRRCVPTSSEHSALNYLIQSCGAILCKRWICDATEDLASRFKQGWDGDFVPMLWVHDELQVAVRKGLEKEVGETIVKMAKSAGLPYGFRLPLDSSYSVGRNWSETH